MPEVEKRLTADVARALYISNYPLKMTVATKFSGDHLLQAPNLSKRTSIDAAIKRYQANQTITRSSWMLMDHSTILNKAAIGEKRALEHAQKQQLAVRINVVRRTVEIERLEYKQRQTYENVLVTVGGETHYLNCVSREQNVDIKVVGDWHPLTGDFELYHYEEKALMPDVMIERYLRWVQDKTTRQYIRPVART